MNLIEQLGGYERAKHEFEMIKEMKPIYPGEIETNNRLLLEYRRQHNIFEVGDLVTYKAHFKGMWREGFGKITEIDEDLEIVNIDENVGVAISEIEHANDEEIKAGKRLEVKSDS
ncbi:MULTISPECIES: hypothetical protein [unclassified Acinetobacter]|uniref:hypothetical protein n=1 Tax=unclassified Acinetobacter TaxID=196816 RepID=UPI0015D296CF|nr:MULTISPECIES: hypothetical protein [unclassified Acinetobacter]